MTPHPQHGDHLEPPPSAQCMRQPACAGVRNTDGKTGGSRHVARKRERASNGGRGGTAIKHEEAVAMRSPPTLLPTTNCTTPPPLPPPPRPRPCAAIDKARDDGQATRRAPAPKPRAVTPPSARPGRNPTTAAPAHRTFFDPWNSSSTGHQRAENRLSGSASWRDSRDAKLREQYRGGPGGGRRVADTVGAGSEDFGKDGRRANGGWERGARGLRRDGQRSLAEVWCTSKDGVQVQVQVEVGRADGPAAGPSRRADGMAEQQEAQQQQQQQREQQQQQHHHHPGGELPQHHGKPPSHIPGPRDSTSPPDPEPDSAAHARATPAQIFAGLCFYLNGSTAPLVSDHRLKHLVAEHGATMATALRRRAVTHVVLGHPSSTTSSAGGSGGGLAAGKLHREMARIGGGRGGGGGGKAVRFVSAEWVLESIKAGRRLPEARYRPLSLASHDQRSATLLLRAGGRPKAPGTAADG